MLGSNSEFSKTLSSSPDCFEFVKKNLEVFSVKTLNFCLNNSKLYSKRNYCFSLIFTQILTKKMEGGVLGREEKTLVLVLQVLVTVPGAGILEPELQSMFETYSFFQSLI